MKKNILIYFLLVFFISCSEDNENIDKIIEKYKSENFKELRGVFITYRGLDGDNVILTVNKFKSNCPPYIVTVNPITKKIIKIEDHLVSKKCDDYFNEKEIQNYTICFLKYNFIVLGVDYDNNVFINPNKQQPPSIIRVEDKYSVNEYKEFKVYKDNWLIAK